MIWIDASFAVEWLLGLPRARGFLDIQGQPIRILPMQYMEILVFFLKRGKEVGETAAELEPCQIVSPNNEALKLGARLYCRARLEKSKASLSDALLAAVCHQTRETLLAFDSDFTALGLKEKKEGHWVS